MPSLAAILLLLAYNAFVVARRLTPPPVTSSCGGTKTAVGDVPVPMVSEECTRLPNIRRSGHFFSDSSIMDLASPPGIVPAYRIGTKDRGSRKHIKDDAAHFHLIAKHLKASNRTKGVAFDIGANRGYYTYYLATMGLTVHAFEIEDGMFQSLQHGTLFNPAAVAERVHLYPLGLSHKVGCSGQKGSQGGGFLDIAADGGGPILAIPLDCFVWHVRPDLTRVDFVKIDVEGFEIAVLQGARQSLLRDGVRIGNVLIEVGPGRWDRAGVAQGTGVEVLKELAGRFMAAHVLIRESGPYAESCAPSLAEKALSAKDSPPVKIKDNVNDNVRMHLVAMEEWQPLLDEMKRTDSDCNFWFSNSLP